MEELDKKLLSKLDEIIRLLRPISYAKSSEVAKMLEEQFLTTAQRKRMYELFDGDHTQQQIADQVGVTSEAVRLLIADLEPRGLIEIVKKGKFKVPKKIY